MVENIRDALAYLLLGSLAPVLFYVMGDVNHSIWPLVAWIFGLIVFVGVFEGPPQPVRHDLGMHARTIEHLDKFEDGFVGLTTAMGLPYVGRERRRWRARR